MILPLVTLLGFERAVLRFYSYKDVIKDFRRTIFSTILGIHVLLLISLVIAYFLGFQILVGLNVFPDLFLVVILVYFQGINLINLNAFRVEEKHKKYFKGRLFIQIAKFILVLSIVYFTNNYLGYLLGSIIAAVVASIIFRIPHTKGSTVFNKKTFSTLLIFSWPLIFHGVASSLLGNADKFILEHFLGLREVGHYTLAYSIGSTMVFAYVGISIFLEPLIYKESNEENRKLLLNKFLILTLSAGFLMFLVILFLTEFVLPKIYDESYFIIFSYIPLIAISYIFYPYYLKSNYLMLYEKKSFNIAFISILSACINIGLNFIFIPIYGIFAAVLISLVTLIFQAIIFVFISNRYRCNRELLELISLSALVVLSVFFSWHQFFIIITLFSFIIYNFLTKIKFMKTKRQVDK